MAATAKVLETTELLEAVLLNLPPRDLLLSMRTCRGFCATIIGSPRLQHALYLSLPAEAYSTNCTHPRYGTHLGEADSESARIHEPTNRGENDQTGSESSAIYQTRMIHGKQYTIERSRPRVGVPETSKTYICDKHGQFVQFPGVDRLDWDDPFAVTRLHKWRCQKAAQHGWRRPRSTPEDGPPLSPLLDRVFRNRSHSSGPYSPFYYEVNGTLSGVQHPTASWRQMFLTEDPLVDVRFSAKITRSDGSASVIRDGRVTDRRGVRAGQLFDSVMKDEAVIAIQHLSIRRGNACVVGCDTPVEPERDTESDSD